MTEYDLLSFRGKWYQKVDGTEMGSLVSVVIAKLVMEDVKERAMANFHSLLASGSTMYMTPAIHYHNG